MAFPEALRTRPAGCGRHINDQASLTIPGPRQLLARGQIHFEHPQMVVLK